MSLIVSTAALAMPPSMHTESHASPPRLTRKERELLAFLRQNAGCCLSRELLLRTIWHYADGARTRTVDVHIQRLRRKLGRDAAALKTIVRMGYCWFAEPDALSRPAA